MIDSKHLLEQVTHSATTLDGIDIERIGADLQAHSLARVVGLVDRDAMRAALQRIADGFDASHDRKHDPRDTEATRRNFQKLQVGANSGMDTRRTLGRVLRILYNPIFAPDVYGLRETFATVARFRNRLLGKPDEFAVAGTDDDTFTCSRLHQYPRGGGFMVPHKDVFSRLASEENDMGYYQIFFLLTEKGTDYIEGGGYIERDGERVLFEDHTRAGDIIIYDGRTVHGVADIDPLHPLELDRFGGRVAGFVSLFRHLKAGDDYAKMSRDAVARYQSDREGPSTGGAH